MAYDGLVKTISSLHDTYIFCNYIFLSKKNRKIEITKNNIQNNKEKGVHNIMKLTQIHHVAIIASNYEKSRHFYVDLLGFEVIRENYRKERNDYKLDLKLGDIELELFGIPGSPQRLSYPEACGLRHLAFKVDNIEEVIEELHGLGIETEPVRIDEFTDKKMTFFADPDGLPLELHE